MAWAGDLLLRDRPDRNVQTLLMKIVVKTLRGQTQELTVQPLAKLLVVKQQIQKKLGVPIENQRLVLVEGSIKTTLDQDSQSLEQCGITAGSEPAILLVVLKLKKDVAGLPHSQGRIVSTTPANGLPVAHGQLELALVPPQPVPQQLQQMYEVTVPPGVQAGQQFRALAGAEQVSCKLLKARKLYSGNKANT